MQSDPPKLDRAPFPPTPTQPTTTRFSPGRSNPAAYTPRTVWQTPHGLAPTFTRARGGRTPAVADLVRRCLRLMYRLRRQPALASIKPVASACPTPGLLMP